MSHTANCDGCSGGWVYAIYDPALVYVGMTTQEDPLSRIRQHSNTGRYQAGWFECKWTARDVEAYLIDVQRPFHNRVIPIPVLDYHQLPRGEHHQTGWVSAYAKGKATVEAQADAFAEFYAHIEAPATYEKGTDLNEKPSTG